MIPKVMPWKKDTVGDLVELLKSGDTLAVIDIHGVPAGAMIGMRKDLRDSMKIQVAKKRLMKIAWEQCGYDYAHLEALFASAVQPARETLHGDPVVAVQLALEEGQGGAHEPG